jgi:hypothetical protein
MKVALGGRRNRMTNTEGRERLAVSLLGKNTDEGIRRPNNLTFISPDGTEYPNIISVKRFADERNMNQVLFNHLANGKSAAYMGWTRKGTQLPFAANVIEYWSRERMLRSYPEYTIIGPDGTQYKTFVLFHFEQEHNCHVMQHNVDISSGVKAHTKGLDTYGRGYRLSTVDCLQIVYKGITYDNVISLGKWASGVGIPKRKIQYFSRTLNNSKTRANKNRLDITITKILPIHPDNYIKEQL